jgi:malonate decarboxylase beta subunit
MSAPLAMLARTSFREASARRRLAAVLDPGTLVERLGPGERVTSPHLADLRLPAAFDDGVIVADGTILGAPVLAASQEGGFLGGSVGEVHGAKLVGLLRRARRVRPRGVVLLLDSGGVRLQEANAGLVAVSEIMRAVLETRAAGIPVVALIGGAWGCFGGMGIVARCCDRIAASEEGRLGLTGPDVLEATKGVEELDASDRALVWRTYGGKHRWILSEVDALVEDEAAAFRAAAAELLARPRPIALAELERDQALLEARIATAGRCAESSEVWRLAGVADPERLPLLDAPAFLAAAGEARRVLATTSPSPFPSSPPGERGQWTLLADPGLDALFPRGHDVREWAGVLRGAGRGPAGEVVVLGSRGGAELGIEAALALAAELLRVVREHPGRPILVLVDSRGQRMSLRDEMLGLNGALGHLAACVELARLAGHRIVTLVRGDAVSGGVLPLGFMADEVDALEGANPWVMSLPAMARVTKLPVEQLEELSRTSPILAPGLDAFVRLGAIEEVWRPPLDAALGAALSRPPGPDGRADRGLSRGGRLLAAPVAARVAGARMTPEALPRRHDLVWLGPGWRCSATLRSAASVAHSSALNDTVAAWVARGLPLVAARCDPSRPAAVALGLALPPGAPLRRIGVLVEARTVIRVAPPLPLAAVVASAPCDWRERLRALDLAGRRAGLLLRVHGSLSWQHLTGDRYVTGASDVDLLVRPRDPAALARALALLAAHGDGWPRLDGEVILPGGRGVAWRELAGGAPSLLVKSPAGVALEPRAGALGALAARQVGRHAIAALREELETSPKPGLVSPEDAGAHDDMDAATFAASLRAIRWFFPAAARSGAEGAGLGALRALGLRAEGDMLAATGGVNTHRGAIFALGALSAAAGRLLATGAAPFPAALRREVRLGIGAALLRERSGKEVEGNSPPRAESHGELVECLHGAGGARAEAAAGFPHVFEVVLPALVGALRRGAGRRAAAIQALLASMAVLPDTNVLWRGGPAGLAFVQRAARELLAEGGVHGAGWEERVRALHGALVARRLSPGGSADLLAAALLVHRLASSAWSSRSPRPPPAGEMGEGRAA